MIFDSNKSYTMEELRAMAVQVKKDLSAAETFKARCVNISGRGSCDVCEADIARLKNQQMLIGRRL